jgi:hypothetical protein
MDTIKDMEELMREARLTEASDDDTDEEHLLTTRSLRPRPKDSKCLNHAYVLQVHPSDMSDSSFHQLPPTTFSRSYPQAAGVAQPQERRDI